MGPAAADDNRGEVDVVGLITHSRGENTKSLLLTDAATPPVSALTPSPSPFSCSPFSISLFLKCCV